MEDGTFFSLLRYDTNSILKAEFALERLLLARIQQHK